MASNVPDNNWHNFSLALLFLVAVFNVFDRQVINVLAQDIKHELHLTDARLGLLTGTAFGLFYAILGIPVGRLADRVERMPLIAAMLGVWSAFTILCGLSANFITLFIARIGVGMGEAGCQPASAAQVADLFHDKRRTSALSVLLVGSPVGSFLGLLIGGLVAKQWGWRAAFLVAGTPGLILACLIFLTTRCSRPTHVAGRSNFEGSLLKALLDLLRKPGFLWLSTAMVTSTFIIYASSAWLPAFFIRAHGLSTAQIGAYAALTVGLGGGIGTLGGGILCDILRPRVRFIESKIVFAVLLLSLPTLLATLFSSNLNAALVAMLLFQICAYSWLAPTTRLIQSASGPAHRSLALAFCNSFSTVLSLACGMPLVGLASDWFTPSYGLRALGVALAIAIPTSIVIALFSHWHILQELRGSASHRGTEA